MAKKGNITKHFIYNNWVKISSDCRCQRRKYKYWFDPKLDLEKYAAAMPNSFSRSKCFKNKKSKTDSNSFHSSVTKDKKITQISSRKKQNNESCPIGPNVEKINLQMTCATYKLCPHCLHKQTLLLSSWPGSVLLKSRIAYCPDVKAEQVVAQEEGKHVFYNSALSAVTVAWLCRSIDFSIGRGRWKTAGEQEHCGE